MTEIRFFVPGTAKTAGSKRAGVVTRKDEHGNRVPVRHPGGGWKTFVKDSSGEPGANWRSDVRDAATAAMAGHPPLDGPLKVDIVVYVRRPAGHYGSGRNRHLLKPSAPMFPITRSSGDADKLARMILDSITEIAIRDDSTVVTLLVRKRYADDRRVGADIEIASALGADRTVTVGVQMPLAV
jgi:Holliday junction resolvase RusA-like endonuclease